jgi:hypothetical protein
MNTAIGPGQAAEAVLTYVKQRALDVPPTESGLAHTITSFSGLHPQAAMVGGSPAVIGTMIGGWLGREALRYGLIYLKHFIANAKAAIAANHPASFPESETADAGEPSKLLQKPEKCPFKRVLRATGRVFEQSAVQAAQEWYGPIVTPETGAALSSMFKHGNHAARPRVEAVRQGSKAWAMPSLNLAQALAN